MTALTVLFGCFGGAFFLDLIFNEGSGTSNLISSFHKREVVDEKLVMCKKIIEEIDSLRDDLEYDNDETEKENILQKIAIREKMLEKLL